MKRDMDLIREILLACEKAAPGEGEVLRIAGRSKDEVAYHARLLAEAGLVLLFGEVTLDDEDDEILINRLTWSGHDFLDAARDDGNWQKVKGAAVRRAVPRSRW